MTNVVVLDGQDGNDKVMNLHLENLQGTLKPILGKKIGVQQKIVKHNEILNGYQVHASHGTIPHSLVIKDPQVPNNTKDMFLIDYLAAKKVFVQATLTALIASRQKEIESLTESTKGLDKEAENATTRYVSHMKEKFPSLNGDTLIERTLQWYNNEFNSKLMLMQIESAHKELIKQESSIKQAETDAANQMNESMINPEITALQNEIESIRSTLAHIKTDDKPKANTAKANTAKANTAKGNPNPNKSKSSNSKNGKTSTNGGGKRKQPEGPKQPNLKKRKQGKGKGQGSGKQGKKGN